MTLEQFSMLLLPFSFNRSRETTAEIIGAQQQESSESSDVLNHEKSSENINSNDDRNVVRMKPHSNML